MSRLTDERTESGKYSSILVDQKPQQFFLASKRNQAWSFLLFDIVVDVSWSFFPCL